MKILIISAKSPQWSANLGYNTVKRKQQQGHEVDFLSKYATPDPEPWMHSVFQRPEPTFHERDKAQAAKRSGNIVDAALIAAKVFAARAFHNLLFWKEYPDCNLKLIDESKPLVDTGALIDAIPDKKYDLVITIVWEGLLSAASLKAIYDKLHCPIQVNCIDMFPMTGGCYYFGKCNKYKNQCRVCPAKNLGIHINQAHKNYLLKKSVYSQIDVTFYLNTWMQQRFLESGLFKPSQLRPSLLKVDSEAFKPVDIISKRYEHGVHAGKFVFFCGAMGNGLWRKGSHLLIPAIRQFERQIDNPDDCLLIVAGDYMRGLETLRMPVRHVGYLTRAQLADFYALSDVYLSPSIDDAGPSMVNQALMCGTPVVAFEVGTAVDIVKTGQTGYLSRLYDTKDFANGMLSLYRHPDLQSVKDNCRQFALSTFKQLS